MLAVDYAEDQIELPHHQETPFKNYTLSNKHDPTSFQSFQPIVTSKSRGKERERIYENVADLA